MVSIRGALRGVAVVAATVGFAALPAVVSAQGNGGAEGPLTVEVVVTGDAGGLPSAVTFAVARQSTSENVLNGTGQSTPQTFTLPAGSYVITPSVADPAYTITDTSCTSQAGAGPNRPDFIIDGTGQGGGGPASCVITVRYTAPPPTDSTTTTTTTTTTPPSDTTTTTTAPGATTTTAPAGATTTTVAAGALPPAGGGSDVASGATPTGTMPVTGPSGQTPAIALTALGMMMLGAGALTLARRH
jgi:hypothetical protein